MTTQPKAPRTTRLALEKQIEHDFSMALLGSHAGYELLDQPDGRQIDRLLFVAREYRMKLLGQEVKA